MFKNFTCPTCGNEANETNTRAVTTIGGIQHVAPCGDIFVLSNGEPYITFGVRGATLAVFVRAAQDRAGTLSGEKVRNTAWKMMKEANPGA